jgi:beta-glucosidase
VQVHPEASAKALLERMTLAETVGQLVQVAPSAPNVERRIREGSVGSMLSVADPERVAYYQELARTSRLAIPLIFGFDVIHGHRTVFPIPLAESCTWDPRLLEQATRFAGEEASACGIDWIFAPVVDVSRDPRWGRIAEGAGEDPWLGARLAEARVRALTSLDTVAACPKHYVAYGAVEAGRDYNTVDISERALRDVYLPPFKAAFAAGADTVMSAFNDIAGVPATCNSLTLRRILREEWQWPGVVLSDYTAIRELTDHGVASDVKDAARLSMLAGVDMDMASDAYAEHLEALVHEGSVPERLVRDAARRVLALKFKLGLFDRRPFEPVRAAQALLTPAARALALDVARASMVLLKNDGDILPLSADARVAVIGPLADARADMLGCWAPAGRAEDVETVLDCLPAGTPHVLGCPVRAQEPVEFEAAVLAARAVDVIVLVLGESADMSGEAHSRVHLGLPGRQQELADAIAGIGKPVVSVVMAGRPLAIPRLVEQSRAVLYAWHGGIRAGRAVTDLLFGLANPSGRLTVSMPRAEGQIPIYYAHRNTGRPAGGAGTKQFDAPFKSNYLDEPNTPLFCFGFGLSYTSFAYRELVIENRRPGRDDVLVACALVENTGPRSGVETVQLYVRDLVASVARPVRELRGFQRIELQPGESRQVRFEVPCAELGFHNHEMQYVIEPGEFAVWIGPDSSHGLEARFTVV